MTIPFTLRRLRLLAKPPVRAAGAGLLTLATFALATSALANAPTPITPAVGCDLGNLQAAAPDAVLTSVAMLSTPTNGTNYCRVDGYITTQGPGPDSNRVRFVVALPASFSARYYFIGEGGSAGYIPPIPEKLLTGGYAVAGSDAGSPTSGVNWMFAIDRTKAFDYAQRGVHVSAVATQAITRAYYGLGAKHPGHHPGAGAPHGDAHRRMARYIDGCSGGGRMGIVAASWYPDDFDGVIAGAPGISVSNQMIFGKIAKHLIDHPLGWVSPAQLMALEQALVQRFDAADGALDGLISDPSKVVIDDALLAPFTPAQRQTLRIVIDGMSDFGLTYPGYSLGNPIGWSAFMLGTSAPPWALAPGRFPPAGYFVFDTTSRGLYGPAYDFTTQFSFANAADVIGWNAKFEQVFIGSGTAQPGNLRRFLDKGGKLLFWHGMADNGISMFDTLRFYNQLAGQRHGVDATRQSSRLFLVPGVQHCAGGIGPQDVPDQALTAITRWVEAGEPPRQMVANRVAGTLPARGFLLCAHPERAVFKGGLENRKGLDVNSATNWRCVRSQDRHEDRH